MDNASTEQHIKYISVSAAERVHELRMVQELCGTVFASAQLVLERTTREPCTKEMVRAACSILNQLDQQITTCYGDKHNMLDKYIYSVYGVENFITVEITETLRRKHVSSGIAYQHGHFVPAEEVLLQLL